LGILTHLFSETANFILGEFNNHITHHLFPHFYHIYYPKLNKILYQVFNNNGVKSNQIKLVILEV